MQLSDRTSERSLDMTGEAPAGIELYYERRGAGRPLVFLHGLGATSYAWTYLVDDLSARFETITLDLMGFGRSPKPRNQDYGPFAQARHVLDFLIKHDLRDVTLVGNSMGGGIALALMVGEFPQGAERVSSLVLLDTVAYPQKIPFYLDMIRKPILGEQLLGLLPAGFIIRKVLEFGYSDRSRISKSAIQTYAKPLKERDGQHALLAAVRSLIPDNIDNITPRYKNIDIPVLIIWGARDNVVPIAVGQKLHAAIKDSVFAQIENCGHLPQEECPEETLQLVKKFLGNLNL